MNAISEVFTRLGRSLSAHGLFVRGGFADVTPAGLTILAEEAVDLSKVDAAKVSEDLEAARSKLLSEGKDSPHQGALQAQIDYLTDLKAAVVH